MASHAETGHLRRIRVPRAPRPGNHFNENALIAGSIAAGLAIAAIAGLDAVIRYREIQAQADKIEPNPGIMTPDEIKSVLGRNLTVFSQGEGEPLKAEFSETTQILELQGLSVDGSVPFTRQILDRRIQAQEVEPNVLIAGRETVVFFMGEYSVEADSLKASHFTLVSGTRYEGVNGDIIVSGGDNPEVGLWAMPVDSFTGVPVDPRTNQPLAEGQQPFFTQVDYLNLNIPAAAAERAIALS